MERMWVTAMKITKKGQTVLPEDTPPELSRESPRRENLRERMKEIGKRQRARVDQAVKTTRKREEDARSQRRPRSAPRDRRTVRREDDKGANRPWRTQFLAQAGICAVVLASVLLFQSIDTPLTNEITDGLSGVVTMEVDVGRDLGRLQFVKNIVPESVLTFWEATAEEPKGLVVPFQGTVSIGFSADQPGIVYTGQSDRVVSAADGTVDSVREAEDGGYVVKIRHDGGLDTVYALLRGVKVAPGDQVTAGQDIALALEGSAGYYLYFQALRAGTATDPAELFAL